MTRYSFILTQENRDKLLSSGLNIEPRLLDKKIFFEDTTTFYNCSTNCGTIYPMGGYSFARTGHNLFKVGNYCSIDNNVRLMAENHPYERFTISTITYQKNAGVGLEAVFRASGLERLNKIEIAPNPAQHSGIERLKKFRIASEVWIRHDCLLANNIKIGTGSCIEQGSLVVKDVPPYAIVAGNPAKIIAYRFSDKIIEKLLETKWSEYDITPMEIRGDIPIEKFIDTFYDYKDRGKLKPIILKNLKEVLDNLEISYAIG